MGKEKDEKKKADGDKKKDADKDKKKSSAKDGDKKAKDSKDTHHKSSATKDADKKAKKPTKSSDGKKAQHKARPSGLGRVSGKLFDEFDKWLDSDVETAMLEFVKANDEDMQVVLRFGDKDEFSVTYPEDYPNSDDNFFVFSERMDAFNDAMQDVCDRKMTFAELLTHAATAYLKHAPASDDEGEGGADDFKLTGDDDDDFNADDDFAYNDERKKKDEKKEYDAVDDEFANKKFLEIGSPSASLRLLKDLKTIRREGEKKLGFSANPVKEPGKNLENLYRWEVRLFDFDGEVGKDLQRLNKKHIELEMRFSKDYPFAPPFVRVVRPKFKFQTGHVTVGGSICMELLTNSGWRSTNDIESILIQIRAEMNSGGARIESDATYNESEAWDAFYRAAGNHGWDVKNLNANMFPKI